MPGDYQASISVDLPVVGGALSATSMGGVDVNVNNVSSCAIKAMTNR